MKEDSSSYDSALRPRSGKEHGDRSGRASNEEFGDLDSVTLPAFSSMADSEVQEDGLDDLARDDCPGRCKPKTWRLNSSRVIVPSPAGNSEESESGRKGWSGAPSELLRTRSTCSRVSSMRPSRPFMWLGLAAERPVHELNAARDIDSLLSGETERDRDWLPPRRRTPACSLCVCGQNDNTVQ